jgi:hypothetical protein
MRRPFLVALLAFGTVMGFGSGFAHMRHRGYERRAEFERHVADVCVEAAREAEARAPTAAMVAPAPAPVAAPATATATSTPAPAAQANVSPTTIYVLPSLVPGYPYAQSGTPAPVTVVPTQVTPVPAVPAAKP